MSQLSLFSAESVPPAVTDLSGLLAATGQVVSTPAADGGSEHRSEGRARSGASDGPARFSTERARISVVVASDWHARAVAAFIAECGLTAEITRSQEGRPLVRTESVPELAPLAALWTKGAVKAVPVGWLPSGRELRIWVLAAGYSEHAGERFVLGLDPHAPDTHAPLAQSLMRAGIAPTLIGTRGPNPGLRITGHRRLARLAESIGAAPSGVLPGFGWPSAHGARGE